MISYYNKELDRNENLLKDGFFNEQYSDDKGQKSYILKCYKNNLYPEIKTNAIEYFVNKWHKDKDHTNSSQIACINHLFSIAHDDNAVLEIANGLGDFNFQKVVGLTKKGDSKKYIAFEVTDKNNHLGEKGNYKTQIDAIILAKNANNETTLIVIEWKYTENEDANQSKGASGLTRMATYYKHIQESHILKPLTEEISDPKKDLQEVYTNSIYYYKPFYQLMRQTLWAEKNLQKNLNEKENFELEGIDIDTDSQPIKINDYLHVHVIPKENDALLGTHYAFDEKYRKYGREKFDVATKKNLKDTWQKMLKGEYKSKYIIKDPKDLFTPIVRNAKLWAQHSDLIRYLMIRYW